MGALSVLSLKTWLMTITVCLVTAQQSGNVTGSQNRNARPWNVGLGLLRLRNFKPVLQSVTH